MKAEGGSIILTFLTECPLWGIILLAEMIVGRWLYH